MKPSRRSLVVAICALSGCQFVRPEDVPSPPDAPPPIDAAVDAAPACVANTIVCDDARAHFVDCAGDGTVRFEMDCPLGCAVDEERCVDIDPANLLAEHLDRLRIDGAPTLAVEGDATITASSTETVFVNGDGSTRVLTSVRQNGMVIIPLTGLTVAAQGRLSIASLMAPAFVVDGPVEIRGLIDVAAAGRTSGPGTPPYHLVGQTMTQTCRGRSTFSQSASSGAGGGGGGHVTDGAPGGTAPGELGGAGGAAESGASLEPLIPGCPGGLGFGPVDRVGPEGGGGGAIQISSTRRIDIRGAGRIDASGGGGSVDSQGLAPGGGGGAGGGVLLEAPIVVVRDTSVRLDARGGGGGGGGGGQGEDGGHGSNGLPASGGWDLVAGHARGGTGGTATAPPGSGGAAQDSNSQAGGGGGAVGLVRVNTPDGTFTPEAGAEIWASWSVGTLRTRRSP